MEGCIKILVQTVFFLKTPPILHRFVKTHDELEAPPCLKNVQRVKRCELVKQKNPS